VWITGIALTTMSPLRGSGSLKLWQLQKYHPFGVQGSGFYVQGSDVQGSDVQSSVVLWFYCSRFSCSMVHFPLHISTPPSVIARALSEAILNKMSPLRGFVWITGIALTTMSPLRGSGSLNGRNRKK
jgi:hypothetical protein